MNPLPNRTNIKMKVLEISPNANNDMQIQESSPQQRLFQQKLSTGTTTVAFKVKNGVIIAADNRATMGFYVANKNARKVHKIQDHIIMTIAGSVADGQYLVDLLRAEAEIYKLRNGKDIGVSQAAKLMQNILYNEKGAYEVGHILAGITPEEGPQVFNIGGYGSLLSDDFVSIGSGSVYALGVLETEWHMDLTLEQGIELGAKAVRSSIIRDIASGNGIDIIALELNKPMVERRYEISDKSLVDNTFAKNLPRLDKKGNNKKKENKT